MSLAAAYWVRIERAACTGCGLCVDFCPVGVFRLAGDVVEVATMAACYGCETCQDLCASRAIDVAAIRRERSG
jgi:Pyruvate/2-oxoacid:ferredoxin oxidoreductase delta subunit